jgi:lactoylglutathione lyase
MAMPASLRIELFVADLDAFVDFYTRVLGFHLSEDRRGASEPYAAVDRDGVRIGAVLSRAEVDRSARSFPTGVEIVLDVDDVLDEHARVLAGAWPLEGDIGRREWGLTDFRVHDPDGYYVRVTSRS